MKNNLSDRGIRVNVKSLSELETSITIVDGYEYDRIGAVGVQHLDVA